MDIAIRSEDIQSSKHVLSALFKICLFRQMQFVGSPIFWLHNEL